MSDISVFGLGLMGSALAKALIRGGHRVTVWNRSPAKADALVELGATRAASVAAAIDASPITMICVDNYQVTRSIFESADAAGKLSGRIVIQLSTGTPKDARECETWFSAHGAQYLDGGILAGPSAIGTPNCTILYSGKRKAFDGCVGYLKSLGDDARFVGEAVGSAAALDMAWLSKLYGMFAGVAHGAIICETEGVDLDHYAKVFHERDNARWMVEVIGKGAFENPSATLKVWNAALHRIRDHADNARINSEVPDFVTGILDRAEAAGYSEEHIAAMVKVLRGDGR